MKNKNQQSEHRNESQADGQYAENKKKWTRVAYYGTILYIEKCKETKNNEVDRKKGQ